MIDNKITSLFNQIFARIEEDILNGKYPSGSVIDEAMLCTQLKVGRSTVKEAIIRLEAEKLVAEAGDGYVVLGITDSDIHDMYDVKLKVEVPAAVLAAKNMSDEAVAELGRVLAEQEEYVNAGDAVNARNMDTRFHDLIYAACGSITYEIILSPIHHKLAKYRRISLENKFKGQNALSEHRAIYEAIAARNPEEVEKTMRAHIENAYGRITDANEKKQGE